MVHPPKVPKFMFIGANDGLVFTWESKPTDPGFVPEAVGTCVGLKEVACSGVVGSVILLSKCSHNDNPQKAYRVYRNHAEAGSE